MTRLAWFSWACLALAGCGSTTQEQSPSEILHVRGDRVVDREQKPVWLRGLQFTNWAWDDSADRPPASTYADLSDYQRAATMGVNTISLFLRSDQFEVDAAPYEYQESGFDWLDQHVAWAKPSGIRLVLTLLSTPGSLQSKTPCDGNTLWDVPDYQERTLALWQALARRYANEPVIAGYNPLTLPVPSGPAEQWPALAKRLVSAIRAVDRQHIVVIEATAGAACAYASMLTGADLFRVQDPNVLYAFDANTPWSYVTQLLPSYGVDDSGAYPDDSWLILNWSKTCADDSCALQWKHASWDSTPPDSQLLLRPDQTSWTEQRFVYRVTNPDYQIGVVALESDRNLGKVYFDDFTINEYDEELNFVRTVRTLDPEQLSPGWYLYQGDESACTDCSGAVTLESDAHRGHASFSVSGTTTGANLANGDLAFPVKLNNTYELRGWIKGENSAPRGESRFLLIFWKYNQESPLPLRNRDGMALSLQSFVGWGKAERVPLYVDGFMTGRPTFSSDKGGLRWVEDMIDLMKANNFHFAYNEYKGDDSGIYAATGDTSDPATANQPLIDLFTRELTP